MKFVLITLLLISLFYTAGQSQKVKKEPKVDLSWTEVSFLKKVDYDLRNPKDEITYWNMIHAFYPDKTIPTNEAEYIRFIQAVNQRMNQGLRNEANLLDIMAYYEGANYNSNTQLNIIAIGTSLRGVFPELEDSEIKYLMKLTTEGLKKKCHQYAQYLEQTDFTDK